MTKASRTRVFFVLWAERILSVFYLVNWHTVRIQLVQDEYSPKSKVLQTNCIFVFWHAKTFLLIPQWRDCALVTLSLLDWKNLVLERFFKRMGYQTVPFTSRIRATKNLVSLLSRGRSIALAVDGPDGPRGNIKKGAIYLSKRTGKPIVVARVRAEKSIRIRSRWDHYEIPMPFTKAVIEMSLPIHPQGSDWTEMENEIRQRLGDV